MNVRDPEQIFHMSPAGRSATQFLISNKSDCFLDYFPSPTRIMHEIQFQLLLQHQQQNHQQKTSNHPPDLQPKPPQPPLHQQPIVQPIMIQSGDQQTQQLTQQKQMPCRVAPPRPPRQKHKKSIGNFKLHDNFER